MTHRELGARILEKLEQDLADVGEVEARPRMEGNQMFIILGPKRHKGVTKPETSGTAPAISKVVTGSGAVVVRNERSEKILRDCVSFADEGVRAPSETKD